MQDANLNAISLTSAAERLARDHPHWQLTPTPIPAIRRSWEFEDFSDAFAFMTRVALLAEQQGHHPEWTNVYRWVDIRLTTHDVGGLSEKDFRLARSLDRLPWAAVQQPFE
jgi:4a-hydroxytetrahydrobiopterin dehydratase